MRLRGRRREAAPREWAEVYKKLANNSDTGIAEESDALALVFGDAAATKSLAATSLNAKAPADRRHRALELLVEAHVKFSAGEWIELLDDPAMRLAALRDLGGYDYADTPGVLLARYPKLSAEEKIAAIDTLTARPAYAKALLKAVERKQIPASDVSISAARQMQNLRNRAIDKSLARVWGTLRNTPADKKEQIQKYKNLLTPAFMKTADPSAGRLVFSKTCMTCHTLYGVGGKIGPDLTGANRGNRDYVLQKVVDPSAAVPNDYQMQLITLNDGRLVSGIIRQRTPRAIVVQTETALLTIATADIAEMKSSGQSMMPERQFKK